MGIGVASARMTKRGGSSNTITAPEKATQQHCEWLCLRGLEGCVIQVPPVVKLRHAKVGVSIQCPRKKPVVACIRPRIALFGDFFPRENSLEKCVGISCIVVAVVPDSVAVVVCRPSASGRVGT